MAGLLFTTVLVCAWINSLSGSSLKVTTKPQHLMPALEKEVTLDCTIEGTGYSPFSHPITWFKSVEGEDIQMNSMVVINKPWKKTGRYEITANMTQSQSVMQLPLTIHDVKLGDNGTYKCQLESINEVLGRVEHTIMVPVPMDSLTLVANISRSANNSRDTFEFIELEASYVSCKVVGGHPKPSMRIMRGKIDITSEFTHLSQDRRHGKRGLQETVYHQELVSRTFRVTHENNGETLRCIAKVPKYPEFKKSTSAVMNVKYAPIFECGGEESVFPDVDNVTLECRINSNPPVDIESIIWVIGTTGHNITLERGYDTYSTNATIEDTGDTLIHLFIANVTNTTFQTYHLFVSNEVAQRHHDILLSEAFTTVAPTTEEMTTAPPSTKKPRVEIVIDAKPAKPVIASGDSGSASTTPCSLIHSLLTVTLSSLLLISCR